MTAQSENGENSHRMLHPVASTATAAAGGGVLGAALGGVFAFFSPESQEFLPYVLEGSKWGAGSFVALYLAEPAFRIARGAAVEDYDDNSATESAARLSFNGRLGVKAAVNKVFEGTTNRGLAHRCQKSLESTLTRYPLEAMEETYMSHRDSLLADYFGVFDTFEHAGRTIDPRESLDEFFEYGRIIYGSAVDALCVHLGEVADPGYRGVPYTSASALAERIEHQVDLAQDVAIWAQNLTGRPGMVGHRARSKLRSAGITEPASLPRDVRCIGENILRIYERVANPE